MQEDRSSTLPLCTKSRMIQVAKGGHVLSKQLQACGLTDGHTCAALESSSRTSYACAAEGGESACSSLTRASASNRAGALMVGYA